MVDLYVYWFYSQQSGYTTCPSNFKHAYKFANNFAFSSQIGIK